MKNEVCPHETGKSASSNVYAKAVGGDRQTDFADFSVMVLNNVNVQYCISPPPCTSANQTHHGAEGSPRSSESRGETPEQPAEEDRQHGAEAAAPGAGAAAGIDTATLV